MFENIIEAFAIDPYLALVSLLLGVAFVVLFLKITKLDDEFGETFGGGGFAIIFGLAFVFLAANYGTTTICPIATTCPPNTCGEGSGILEWINPFWHMSNVACITNWELSNSACLAQQGYIITGCHMIMMLFMGIGAGITAAGGVRVMIDVIRKNNPIE